jgi:hypothetical protein
MSTVFPDADAVPVEPPAGDEELLEQPTDAIAAIATAAIAGVSLLPFKICILSLTGSSACLPRRSTGAAIRDQIANRTRPSEYRSEGLPRAAAEMHVCEFPVIAVVQLRRPAMEYPTWPEE